MMPILHNVHYILSLDSLIIPCILFHRRRCYLTLSFFPRMKPLFETNPEDWFRKVSKTITYATETKILLS